MAAYAIASVKQKIEHLLHAQTNVPMHLPFRAIKSFKNDLSNLELVISWQRRKNLIAIDLEQQIEDVVDGIEDLIGSHFSSLEYFLKVAQEITCLMDKLKKGEYKIEVDPPPLHFSSTVDDDVLFGRYDSILGSCPDPVGLEGEIRHIKYRVMVGSVKLKAIIVVGMAGCGKTALVKQVYSELVEHFDIHLMCTFGRNFTLLQILVHLLTTLGFRFNGEILGEYELGMSLKNLLTGRRFLCVLDNLWDSDTCQKLYEFFPDEGKGSRIMCASRDATILSGGNHEIHYKRFLDDDDSWELLRNVVFTSTEFQGYKLEEIGKKIAKKCEGLPLAIISMGKLLRESETTVERWEKVLDDDDPFRIGRSDSQPISKSLYLSYDLLPYHLKACFLYMGVLSQNYVIRCSRLVVLLIAEGFIPPEHDEGFTDTTWGYLDELHKKSMVFYGHTCSEYDTIIPIFKVHFVFRSLCIGEARDEKFILPLKKYVETFPTGTNLPNRLCIHNNTMMGFREVHNSMESISGIRSILYCGQRHQYPLQVFLNFKSLKILHALSIRFYEFPLEVLELFRLRYLAITYDGPLPKSISKLWKLEFLILDRHYIIKSSDSPSYLPVEIWNMQWLRHLRCTGFDLPEPNSIDFAQNVLSELLGVSARSCIPKILAKFRNLQRLAIRLEVTEDEVESFTFFRDITQNLHRLFSFKCVVLRTFNSPIIPPIPIFPTSIKELTLNGCGFPWKYMATISVLPNLFVLKLKNYAFCGNVWEVCDGGFLGLQYLYMKDLNIEEWRAKPHHFPKLFSLEIYHCYNLQEIPTEFGEHPKLGRILLFSNKLSVEISARLIQHRRQVLGDDEFDLKVSKLGRTGEAYVATPQDDHFFSTLLEDKES